MTQNESFSEVEPEMRSSLSREGLLIILCGLILIEFMMPDSTMFSRIEAVVPSPVQGTEQAFGLFSK